MAASDNIRRRAQTIIKRAREVTQGAALIADRTLVLATPVDTGRARANWNVGIGVLDTRERDPDPSGQAAIERGKQVIASYTTGTIVIANALPYIEALDQGHSAQAPNGMTAQAIIAVHNYVAAQRVL